MEILSPLVRLLGLSERLLPIPSTTRTRLDTKGQHGSKQTQSREGQTALLARLHALPPTALQRFIQTRLPILEDPRFPLALARYAQGQTDHPSTRQTLPTLQEPQLLRDATGMLWRAYGLPIVLEGRLEHLRFYQALPKSHEKKSDKKKSRSSSQRLVFAMVFSHTGPLEIEAEQTPQRLRVAVRTRSPFPPQERNELRDLFHKMLETLSLRGQILFQTMPTLPMDALEERARERDVSYEDFL